MNDSKQQLKKLKRQLKDARQYIETELSKCCEHRTVVKIEDVTNPETKVIYQHTQTPNAKGETSKEKSSKRDSFDTSVPPPPPFKKPNVSETPRPEFQEDKESQEKLLISNLKKDLKDGKFEDILTTFEDSDFLNEINPYAPISKDEFFGKEFLKILCETFDSDFPNRANSLTPQKFVSRLTEAFHQNFMFFVQCLNADIYQAPLSEIDYSQASTIYWEFFVYQMQAYRLDDDSSLKMLLPSDCDIIFDNAHDKLKKAWSNAVNISIFDASILNKFTRLRGTATCITKLFVKQELILACFDILCQQLATFTQSYSNAEKTPFLQKLASIIFTATSRIPVSRVTGRFEDFAGNFENILPENWSVTSRNGIDSGDDDDDGDSYQNYIAFAFKDSTGKVTVSNAFPKILESR